LNNTMMFSRLALLVLVSYVALGDAGTTVTDLSATGLSGDAFGNRPDPYVKLFCNNSYGGRTDTIKGTHSPNWAGRFTFSCRPGATLKLEVWDQDINNDDRLGTCTHKLVKGTHGSKCSLKKGTVRFNYSSS
uniref:C2 domain-containing protein n=1 Tax=Astyanax mexicanus TaxID=7994 RepID=A0A3B1J9L1_ASTMX